MKNTPTLKRHIIESAAVAVVLTGVSYLVAWLAGWITEVNWLEFAAVFTSYATTYLSVKQRRLNYALGVVTTSLYCVLFWQWGLLSSMALQLYLIPTLIYGWFRWGKDKVTRPVKYALKDPKWIPLYLGVTAVLYFGAIWVTGLMGAQFAPFDAAILACTILAQFLLDNKKIETWVVWAAVNVLAIYVYFTSGLYIAAFQYVFFLLNTAYGWWSWKRTMLPVTLAVDEEDRAALSSFARIHN